MTRRIPLVPFALAVVVGGHTAPATAGEDVFDLERTAAVLTREIERQLANGTASVSIALVRGEEIVWSAAFGHANVWAKTPATPETLYCTGSTLKAVTATAVLQLVERGDLALDDPVNDHLGDHRLSDLEDDPVTVRHLLSHTSGLERGAARVPVWRRELPRTLAELVGDLEVVRPPGERYEYNNGGYAVAGLLIEQVTGQSFATYVTKDVLRPLGVKTQSPARPTPEMVERMALPYVAVKGRPVPTAQVRYDVVPAGDFYLTAEEMARFLGAHLNGGAFRGARILSAASVAEAHRPQGVEYGLGWSVNPKNPGFIEHGGGVPGFSTAMAGDLDAKVGAYVMSNSGDMSGLAEAAVALLRGEDWVAPEDRVAVEIEETLLEECVGRYELPSGTMLTITLEDGHLVLDQAGARYVLLAAARDRFFLRDVDVRVRFGRDDEGRVDHLTVHQAGVRRARRLE